jgi:hypothetical protein
VERVVKRETIGGLLGGVLLAALLVAACDREPGAEPAPIPNGRVSVVVGSGTPPLGGARRVLRVDDLERGVTCWVFENAGMQSGAISCLPDTGRGGAR